MMPELKLKNLPYIAMFIILVVSMIVMIYEKIDICIGLMIFIVCLGMGMFHLMFLDTD